LRIVEPGDGRRSEVQRFSVCPVQSLPRTVRNNYT
jgi:hypothetical protein